MIFVIIILNRERENIGEQTRTPSELNQQIVEHLNNLQVEFGKKFLKPDELNNSILNPVQNHTLSG